MNLFAYCGNNPIMNVDPDGHFWFAAICIAVATVIVASIFTSSSNKLPVTGKPNSTSSSYDNSGNKKQDRTYDEQGEAKQDTDYGHADHHPDLQSPHYHDWDWSSGVPKRGDAHNAIVSISVIIVSALTITYLALNDATVIGIADDAAIPAFGYLIYNEFIILME